MLSMNDPFNGNADFVERTLSDAYKVVKEVRDNLDPIKTMADSLDFLGPATGISTALTVAQTAATNATTAKDLAVAAATSTSANAIAAASSETQAHNWATAAQTAASTINIEGINSLLGSNNAAMINLSDGSKLSKMGRGLSWGLRRRMRTLNQAKAAIVLLKDQIKGYAGPEVAATTGGYGYPILVVNNPSLDATIQYSFGWALAQWEILGGAQILLTPRGKMNIVLPNQLVLKASNLTLYAPGLNVTIWADRLEGAFNTFGGSNHIFYGVYFHALAGPMNGTAMGENKSRASSLFNIRADMGDRYAFMNCEFRNPSWHCLDIAHNNWSPGSLAACRATVQNCIFWDAIQGHLIGTNNSGFFDEDTGTQLHPYTDDTTARQTFVTFFECIWAYNLERNPKVLGAAHVDIVNCYTLVRPYVTEYVNYTDYKGVYHTYDPVHLLARGVTVQEGGHALIRGCLFQSAHESTDGTNATYLSTEGYSGNSGRIKIQDSAAENSMVLTQRNPESVAAVPYTLPHTAVPVSGPGREAWLADIWSRAGARPDPAPQGNFISVVADSSFYPDGETILLDKRTDRSTMLVRVDALDEYEKPAPLDNTSVRYVPRGSTRVVGKSRGASTGAAIEPKILDITQLGSTYFSVVGNGGPSSLRDIVSSYETDLKDGLTLELFGSAANPVTLESASTIAATVASTAADTLTVTGHGRTGSGFWVILTTTGILPAPLVSNTRYYGVYVDANTIKLATTYSDALAGTNLIDITDAGTGTHTARVGAFDLPGGRSILLNSSAEVLELHLNSANQRLNVKVAPAPAAATVPTLASGNNLPTLYGVANVSTSPAPVAASHKWTQIGSIVTGMLRLSMTPVANATTTTLQFDLPVATNMTVTGHLVGEAILVGATGNSQAVQADTATDRAQISFQSTGTTLLNYVINYMYEVI